MASEMVLNDSVTAPPENNETTGEIESTVQATTSQLARLTIPKNPKESKDGPICSKPQCSPEISSTNDRNAQISGNIIQTQPANLNIIVNPSIELKVSDRIYKMTSCPRGICMIINNVDFEPCHIINRDSSHSEAGYLCKLFTQLGFEVHRHNNLITKEMISTCREMSENEQLNSHDAFVMIILTHGERGFLMGSDGNFVSTESIVGLFNNYHCKQLINKPKMFFIQACRGKKIDLGVIEPETAADAVPTPEYVAYKDHISLLPSWSDMVICYPTLEGFSALRHEFTGSWLGNALIKVFSEKAHDTELHELLMQVNDIVSRRRGNDGEFEHLKQVVEVVYRGWRKHFYFNVGLYEI